MNGSDMITRTERTACTELIQVCEFPRIYVADGFATPAECGQVIEMGLAEPGPRSAAGFSCELPVDSMPLLSDLEARMASLVGMANEFRGSLRFRSYESGESHPLHEDTFDVGDLRLVVTCLLYLTGGVSGGGTGFPEARPNPVTLEPAVGRMAVWFSSLANAETDPLSTHAGLPVTAGHKATLANFIYRPIGSLLPDPPGVPRLS